MTFDETAKLLGVIHSIYPDVNASKSPEVYKLRASIWHEILADYPFETVLAAFKAYSATSVSDFGPRPGQLLEIIHNSMDNYASGEEAWAMIIKAMKNSSYHSEEEFQNLPETVKKCVGSSGVLRSWALIPTDELNRYTARDFKKSYATIVAEQKAVAKMPQSSKNVLLANESILKLE